MKKSIKKLVMISMMMVVSLLSTSCGESSKKSYSNNMDINSGDITVSVNDNIDLKNVNITFWNPITGPDATYMQELVKQFNDAYIGKIKVTVDSQAEASHYQRILTSFTDNSTADLTMIHKSRIPSFHRSNKLRDMTALLEGQGIKKEDYVGDLWDSGVFDNKVYGMVYDVLPMVIYYNRNLIPEGYSENDILSEDFTLDTMLEMMKKAYVDAPMPSRRTYGMAFNYAYTENMFLSFLAQQNVKAVEENNPLEPTYACEEGYAAAEAVKSIPLTKNDAGKKVSSESGADHLNTFVQGRALFTIDGIWSAPNACKKTERVDAGVALFPKLNKDVERKVFGDGHSLVMFNNKNVSNEKDQAIGIFVKYLIDNSAVWCKGGKVAALDKITANKEYQDLEWGYLSTKLESIVSPTKVYTYDTITNPIGEWVSKLCEETETDVKHCIDSAAKAGKEAASAL